MRSKASRRARRPAAVHVVTALSSRQWEKERKEVAGWVSETPAEGNGRRGEGEAIGPDLRVSAMA